MPSAYHCIHCFEQQNKGQSEHESEKENMFETKLPRVGSLNVGFTQSGFRIQLLHKFKDVSDANQHFYELKQCQINNLIRKSDRVNKPLHQFYDVAAIPCVQ